MICWLIWETTPVAIPSSVKLASTLFVVVLIEVSWAAYSPSFTLPPAMLDRVMEITGLVGQWRYAQSSQVPMLSQVKCSR